MTQDLINSRGMSDESRNFFFPLTVVDPTTISTVELCSVAPFEFDIVDLRCRTLNGIVDFTLEIDGTAVNFDNDLSDGNLTAVEGALVTNTPDGSADSTVAAGAKLTIEIASTESSANGFIVHVNCRRAQKV